MPKFAAADNHGPLDVEESPGCLCVWQISLAQSGNSLVAERLISIPYDCVYIGALTLERHLLAYLISSGSGPYWIEVISWQQWSTTRTSRTSHFSVGHPPPPGGHQVSLMMHNILQGPHTTIGRNTSDWRRPDIVD